MYEIRDRDGVVICRGETQHEAWQNAAKEWRGLCVAHRGMSPIYSHGFQCVPVKPKRQRVWNEGLRIVVFGRPTRPKKERSQL